MFDIDIKAQYTSVLAQCLCFNSKRKQTPENDLMLTVNGLQSFPAQFASPEYISDMFKRRLSGIRRSSIDEKRSSKKKQEMNI